jgi:hypothetical protein
MRRTVKNDYIENSILQILHNNSQHLFKYSLSAGHDDMYSPHV